VAVRPGDDFHRYVNEGWLKTATIPTGLAATDVFVDLFLTTAQRVAGIVLGTLEGKHAPGTPGQQIAGWYRSIADRERRNALGLNPLRTGLAMIAGAGTRTELARVMGFTWTSGPFGIT